MIKKILCSLFGWFCPTPPDPPDPPIPPEPPVEYVYVDTCRKSSLIRNTYCPGDNIDYGKKYVKGTEPDMYCSYDIYHKPPDPPVVYPPQIDDLHCGLGSFLWFLRIAWPLAGREDAIKQLDAFLYELRMRGVGKNKFFCWLQTQNAEHSHLVGKMPYQSVDFVADLDSWNSIYWDLYRIFIDSHVKYGIMPIVNPLMNERYCGLPYQQNKQGVSGFLDGVIRPYHRKMMLKFCQETEAVAGVGNFELKPINELQHSGPSSFHLNGDWYRDMIESVGLNFIPIYKNICDVSESEGCGIYLTEPGMECGKPLNPAGETHGQSQYDRGDITKCVLRELHGVSTLKSLTDSERMMWVTSKNQAYLMDEDGSGHGGDERGFTIGGFSFADAGQTEEMLRYGLGKAKKEKKRFVFSMFPPGFNLDLGPYIEDYSVENLRRQEINFWERLDRAQKVYYEILGIGG